MNQIQRMESNGKWYDEPNTQKFIDRIVANEMRIANLCGTTARDEKQIYAALVDGAVLFYDTDWYAKIRIAPQPVVIPTPELVKCNCGHTIEKHLVMGSSRGSSCPDCYDRMSD